MGLGEKVGGTATWLLHANPDSLYLHLGKRKPTIHSADADFVDLSPGSPDRMRRSCLDTE